MAYVYAILVDGVTRYIGKGNGERCRAHLRKANRINAGRAPNDAMSFHYKLADALARGAAVTHRILADGMSDKAAMIAEAKLIARHRGLWNVCADSRGGTYLIAYHKTPAAAEQRRNNGYKTMANPEHQKEKAVMMKTRMASPAGKAMIAASNKRRMTDPQQRATTIAILAAARDRNNRDPQFHAKRIAGIRAYWEARGGHR